MHSFDFVCLGAGGGPMETDLSGYLLKSSESRWEDGIIAVEAGSGMGALTKILSTKTPFHDLRRDSAESEAPEITAARIYSYIQSFLISHSHLDHVLSLVLSAGSLPNPPPLYNEPVRRRRILGTRQVLEDLSTMIFSDRIWPNLASWSSESTVPDFLYLYEPISQTTNTATPPPDDTPTYHPVNSKISVHALPISHGLCRSNHSHAPSGTYTSSAFFLRHEVTQKQFLFFGDVEPDSLALNPSTRNVWRMAASLITSSSHAKTLDSIFIECSWPSDRKDAELYGHLNPRHLLQEMKVLAEEVARCRETSQVLSSSKVAQDIEPTSPSLPVVNGFHHTSSGSKPVVARQRRRTLMQRISKQSSVSPSGSDLSVPQRSTSSTAGSKIDIVSAKDEPQEKPPLHGIKLYLMHFKAPIAPAVGLHNGKLSQFIASELRSLVETEGLGLQVIAVEQGMRISI